jgi:hypothetical protein
MDVDSPDDQLIWEGIRQDLQRSDLRRAGKRRMIRIRNMAAVIIILLSVGYIFHDIVEDRRMNGKISLAKIDPYLGEKEQEYKRLVSFKKQEAGSYNEIDNVIIAELLEEIQKLDTIYELSMNDLLELGPDEQVIQTIFDTYEKKIYLLELIIMENDKHKNHESDENLFL